MSILGGLLGGCEPDPYPVVKVGVISSFNGGLADFGPLLTQSALLAAREVNAAGGLLDGRRIELVVEDDFTDPDQAVTVARRLIDDEQVAAIIGPIGSGATLRVADLTLAAQIPQVTCCATSPLLTERPESGADRFLFRTVVSDIVQVGVLVDLTTGQLQGAPIGSEDACTSLTILYQDEPGYGVPLANALRDGYQEEAAPGAALRMVPYVPERASYTDVIGMLEAPFESSDCIALIGYAEAARRIFVDYISMYGGEMTQPRWITADGNKSDTIFSEEARPLLFGLNDPRTMEPVFEPLIGTAPAPSGRAELRDFENAYVSTFGGTSDGQYASPGLFAANQYDAAAMLFLAIESAGNLDGRAIRDALQQIGPDGAQTITSATELMAGLLAIREGRSIDYSGASGAVDLDANGDITTTTTRIEVWQARPEGEADLAFDSLCSVAPNSTDCVGEDG